MVEGNGTFLLQQETVYIASLLLQSSASYQHTDLASAKAVRKLQLPEYSFKQECYHKRIPMPLFQIATPYASAHAAP